MAEPDPNWTPIGYEWMRGIGTWPKMVTIALSKFGLKEGPGLQDNPELLALVQSAGISKQDFPHDSVAWCGGFMAWVAHEAGYAIPPHPLWALNWQGFGAQELQPCFGDVLVFHRPAGGHVGLYIAEDDDCYHVLGGNTGDMVKIARIEKVRLVAARAPAWKIGRPASSRPFLVKPIGTLSTNEA